MHLAFVKAHLERELITKLWKSRSPAVLVEGSLTLYGDVSPGNWESMGK